MWLGSTSVRLQMYTFEGLETAAKVRHWTGSLRGGWERDGLCILDSYSNSFGRAS